MAESKTKKNGRTVTRKDGVKTVTRTNRKGETVTKTFGAKGADGKRKATSTCTKSDPYWLEQAGPMARLVSLVLKHAVRVKCTVERNAKGKVSSRTRTTRSGAVKTLSKRRQKTKKGS